MHVKAYIQVSRHLGRFPQQIGRDSSHGAGRDKNAHESSRCWIVKATYHPVAIGEDIVVLLRQRVRRKASVGLANILKAAA